MRVYHVLVSANSRALTVEELEGRRKKVVVKSRSIPRAKHIYRRCCRQRCADVARAEVTR